MFSNSRFAKFSLLASTFGLAWGQFEGVGYPHDYPGKPHGDFSPAWQQYFQVTAPLPNVTFHLPRNFAGNIAVDRPGHPNNTLFFWAFEKEVGSLTASAHGRDDEPWGLWLNGGPGSSSLLGLLFENGPIHIANDYSAFSNPYGWDNLADYVWIDQPVGTGFSTVDETGFVEDEDQMGRDFFGFLANLVKVFPSLKTRPLHITGESYSGTYIPYITKTYFGLEDPPVKLVKIAIGDGTLGSDWEFEVLPTLTVIETYPQLIGYDPDVYKYFREQSHLCGFDINLTYPQHGHFPTLNPQEPNFGDDAAKRASKKKSFNEAFKLDSHFTRNNLKVRSLEPGSERLAKRDQWKRDIIGRPNGTIDPYYGCDLYDEMIDYAVNFSLPWKGNDEENGFDVYQIPDALDPEAPMDASIFLNDNRTRAAIHAPTSKNWAQGINYPFNNSFRGDPSVEPMAFLTELATNASHRGVGVVIYSGNDDSLVSHIGSEVVIQNTTFGGIQGFTRKPSTPWYGDDGVFAGIVHQERSWTYILVKGAGHLVPQQQPERAFVFLREFVFGNNETGLVTSVKGHTTVIGGEDPQLANTVLTGQSGIYYGSGTTQYTYTYPTATIAAWETFIAFATDTENGKVAASATAALLAARTAL